MTRIGMNPARNRIIDYRPARVTLAVIVYIPHTTGYFQNRLEVVRLSFGTLLNNTSSPYDLLVFDNASCEEVKAYLHELQSDGRIRYLLSSSENIGKLGALRVIAGAAPGELIAYADDDTFYYPGWLKAHLKLYDHFPRVGMVSGSPERTLFDHGIQSSINKAASDADFTITYGKRIPLEWEHEWATALGKDVEAYLARIEQLDDIVIEFKGESAYATACHNQFLCSKETLLTHLSGSWSGRLMGGLNEFDKVVDESGLLRLTTIDRTTKLIGNVVSPEMASESMDYGIQMGTRFWSRGKQGSRGFLQRLANIGFVRWLLQGLYNRLFWILSGQSGEWVELEAKPEESE